MTVIQFVCDWCRLTSLALPMPQSGLYVDATEQLPEGWSSIGYGVMRHSAMFSVEAKDAFGFQVSQLCPACSNRTAGDLLRWLASAPSRAAMEEANRT